MKEQKDSRYECKPIKLICDQPVDNLEFDYLGLMPWAKMITSVALGTDGPFVIGVHGKWGHGKTTLLRLSEKLIDENDDNAITVWFNAWQFERENHPVFSLITTIINEINKQLGNNNKINREVKEKLQTICTSLRGLTYGIKTTTDVGIPFLCKTSVEFDAEKALKAEQALSKKFNPLQSQLLYIHAFEKLSETTAKLKQKIIILIDDLDRCQPDKAIYLIESIKLILSHTGFIYILAVDEEVIEEYLDIRYKNFCGDKTSTGGKKYLEKIIQLPIKIPSHRSRFKDFIKKTISSLENDHSESEPLKALKLIQNIIIAGAVINPRSLIRLINNFLLDCTLWPLIEHKFEYNNLDAKIAAALAIDRILQQNYNYIHNDLIYNQRICDLIYNNDIEVLKTHPDEINSILGNSQNVDRMKSTIEALLSQYDLINAIKELGKDWLKDQNLRQAIYEFAKTERAESDRININDDLVYRNLSNFGIKQGDPIIEDDIIKIKRLDASIAYFRDEDIRGINMFINLEWLSLEHTEISDEGLVYIQGLDNLTYLNLTRTRINGKGLIYLEKLPGLKELVLTRTAIQDSALVNLRNLNNLTHLNLADTPITGEGLFHIKDLKNLTNLSLGGNNFIDDNLYHIKDLTNLTALSLAFSKNSSNGLQYIKGLTNLRILHICLSNLTDNGLEHIKDLTNITNLSLREDGIDDKCIEQIKCFINLTDLSISHTKSIKESMKCLEGFRKLTSLSINYSSIDDTVFEYIKEHKNLIRLSLAGSNINGTGLEYIKENLNLRSLDLSSNNLDANTLEYISGLINLSDLSLGWGITDSNLVYIKDLINLNTLDLKHISITDNALIHITNLINLRKLDISHTKVTDAGLAILKELPNLEKLVVTTDSFTEEKLITKDGIENFKKIRPNTIVSEG